MSRQPAGFEKAALLSMIVDLFSSYTYGLLELHTIEWSRNSKIDLCTTLMQEKIPTIDPITLCLSHTENKQK